MKKTAMPCWYYEKKDLRTTPSFQIGVEPDTEARYRREGARFIINTGTKMGLRYDTMATGVVYFHRFYMFHTFKDFPRYVTACCCLFLAGKVEETPKKCKDIIKTARSLLSDHQFSQFGDDPKEEVMTLERILLQTIKFDLQVDHPYGYLLKYAKCLKGDKQKLQKMVQMAWTFVNDSLCTSLCLQWEPEIIAIALMYLAGKLSKFEVTDWNGRQPKHARWWDMYVEDISMELLEDICHQVLDLYSNHPTGARSASPPITPPVPTAQRIVPSVPPPAQPPLPPPVSLPTPPVIISRSNSPSQPPPSVIPVVPPPPQPPKPPKQELGPPIPKPPVVEHKPVHTIPKPHPPPQAIPVVTDTTHTHAPPPAPSGNYYPPAENYTQYSSPAPPPTTYQPPPPPNYAPSYAPVEPAPYDASAAPAVPYTQQPQSQHYPTSYDAQPYTNYPPAAQQYYPPPPQPGYHAQPGQATGYNQPVTQYEDTYAGGMPPQYAATAPATSAYPTAASHAGYPQNPAYPAAPGYPNAPRPGLPQQPGLPKHGPPAPIAGNIAPVRITGRNNNRSWNM